MLSNQLNVFQTRELLDMLVLLECAGLHDEVLLWSGRLSLASFARPRPESRGALLPRVQRGRAEQGRRESRVAGCRASTLTNPLPESPSNRAVREGLDRASSLGIVQFDCFFRISLVHFVVFSFFACMFSSVAGRYTFGCSLLSVFPQDSS